MLKRHWIQRLFWKLHNSTVQAAVVGKIPLRNDFRGNDLTKEVISLVSSINIVRRSSFSILRRSPDKSNRGAEVATPSVIKNVTTDIHKGLIQIEWDEVNAAPDLFPFVWLRDNCQCAKCFHPDSQSRTVIFESIDLDVKPCCVKVENRSTIDIEWSDGHRSHFTSEWLRERTFSEGANSRRRTVYKLDRLFWGSEILQNLPMANFSELMTDDSALLAWLQQLEIFGFVLITNSPAEKGQVRRLAERVAFIKKTHYGAEFIVKAKKLPSNVAYSGGPLQIHTDLPYYEYKPGIQLIHCVVQFEGTGAESLVADAVHVARLLKREQPEQYGMLCETVVDWCDIGNDEGREFHKVLQQPVICLDSQGEITRINFSHPQRDSFFRVDLDVVQRWYKAMKTFSKMLHNPQNCVQFKMAPGNIQSFDNLRIVHGRTSFEDRIVHCRASFEDKHGEREIEGCYMDWDEARSKRRVLERKLNLTSEQWCQNR